MIKHVLLAIAAAALGVSTAQAAPVSHDIGGTLQRVSTSGVDVEAYIAAIGFDGGSFRSLLTLDGATPDSDAAADRGRYLGAVTGSTLRVQGTDMVETGYCNTTLLDCSVEVLNDQPLGTNLLMDSLFLAAQVFAPASPALLPAGMTGFLTLNLFLAEVGAAPDLLDDDGLLTDLPALLAGIPAGVDAFTLSLRGFDTSSSAEFSVTWRIDTSTAPALPEPGTLALVLLALVGLGRAARRV